MDYLNHLNGFYKKAELDKTVTPTQISFYLALFRFWQRISFSNPVSIERGELMAASKIHSKATYHKCLKILHAGGYINYLPTNHPYKTSKVFMFLLFTDSTINSFK